MDAPSGVFNSVEQHVERERVVAGVVGDLPRDGRRHVRDVGLGRSCLGFWLGGRFRPDPCGGLDQRISPFFLNDGATSLVELGVWRVLVCDGRRIERHCRRRQARVVHAGEHGGFHFRQVNAQIFELGVPSSDIRVTIDFDGEGVFSESGPVQACGCTDATAFNYDPDAEYDNGSCVAVVEGCTDALRATTTLRRTRTTAAVRLTTPWVCAAATAPRMQMATGCATTKTTAWAPTTNVGCATVLDRFTNADAIRCLRAIAMQRQ